MQYGRKIPPISTSQKKPRQNRVWVSPIVTALCTAVFTGLVTSVITSYRISQEFDAWQKKEAFKIERDRYYKRLDDVAVLHEKFYQFRLSLIESRSNEVSFHYYEYMKTRKPEYIFGNEGDERFSRLLKHMEESQKKLHEQNIETSAVHSKKVAEFHVKLAQMFYTHGAESAGDLSIFGEYNNEIGNKKIEVHKVVEKILTEGVGKKLPEQDLYNSIVGNRDVISYTSMAEMDLKFNKMVGKLYEYNAAKLQKFEKILSGNNL